jgi:hypothetical protein
MWCGIVVWFAVASRIEAVELQFVATVEVGTEVDCGKGAAATLDFKPLHSAAAVAEGGRFVADVSGDYVVNNRLWRAMVLPAAMGQSSPNRFQDTFHRYRLQASVVEGSTINSDNVVAAWAVLHGGGDITPGCVQGSAVGVAFTCGGAGLVTAVPLPSMFAEPLTLSVGVQGNTNTSSSALVVTFGELLVDVNMTAGAAATAAVVVPHPSSGGSPVTVITAAASEGCSGGQPLVVTLNANAVNCTLHLACAAPSGTYRTLFTPPSLWDGGGTPHGACCADPDVARDAAAAVGFDCGKYIPLPF